jgi:DNA-binding NarL/FixJ family response regulator
VSVDVRTASIDWQMIAGLPSAGEPVPRKPLTAGGPIDADAITVAVFAYDQAAAAGLLGNLSASPDIHVLPANRHAEADVVVLLTISVTDALLSEMEAINARAVSAGQSMVLVSGPLRERHLTRALSCGVVSILPRAEITPRLITRAVIASGSGRAIIPETVARWLVDEARMFQQNVLAVHGLQAGGLDDREVRVLKFLADGLDTEYIAEQLNYSERTIKRIIQDLMTRLGLRNRAHAVSYALRAGVI